jgi:N-succinyldiaminopimelate aminotransferase
MPRHPVISVAAGSLPPSIFARLVERLATHRGDVYPFHLGDTHLLPPEAARLEALEWSRARAETLYRYAAPVGDAELMRALDGKLRAKNGIAGALQITAGATHAIFCAVRACLDPHDEILLCAPHWPLVRGQVLAVGARPVEVPLMSRLAEEPELDVAELLAEHVGPRTSAIYFATPNNPDGKVLGAGALAGIAEVARAHDLWVVADEVYEDYPFDGRHHVSIASLPGMAERTLTVFSFSKSYGQAGLRVGYVVGPEEPIVALRRLANHTVYNVPVAMQRAALVALTEGESFLRAARATYAAARDQTMAALARAGLRARAPEGGSYVFVDLGRDAQPVLERLAAGGVLLAPGSAFGKDYGQFARLCYTATEPARLAAGLEELVRIVAT